MAGSGDQGFSGDGSAATGAILNEPKAVIADPSGNLVIGDTLNQRVRSSTLPTLAFTSSSAGIASAAQAITLTNSGDAALAIAGFGFSAPLARLPAVRARRCRSSWLQAQAAPRMSHTCRQQLARQAGR